MSANIEQDDALLWKEVCEAGGLDDAVKVDAILSCQRASHSFSCHDRLLQSPEAISRLLQSQTTRESDVEASIDVSNVYLQHPLPYPLHQAVHALLLSSSAYDTPWKASCCFVQNIHRRKAHDLLLLRSTIADIQNYLQQVVSMWWEEEKKFTASTASHEKRRRRSIRPSKGESLSSQNSGYWMLKLLSLCMEPLLVPSVSDCDENTDSREERTHSEETNTHWLVSLDVISTIATLSHGLNASLHNAVLDVIFKNVHLRTDRIVPWVNLAAELRTMMRSEDWSFVLTFLKKSFDSQQSCLIPQQDLPLLAEILLSFYFAVPDNKSVLVDLLLSVLSVTESGQDLSTLTKVEDKIESYLAALSYRELSRLTNTVIKTALNQQSRKKFDFCTTIDSTEVNLLLLCWRAANKAGSQMVARLLADAFDRGNGTSRMRGKSGDCEAVLSKPDFEGLDVCKECWRTIQAIAFLDEAKPPNEIDNSSEGTNSEDDIFAAQHINHHVRFEALRQVFDDVQYKGRGHFETKNSSLTKGMIKRLTRIGTLIFHATILDLGDSHQKIPLHSSYIVERARAWALCVEETFKKGQSVDSTELLIAVVILTTLYIEIPSLRLSLVQSILQYYSKDVIGVDIHCVTTVHSSFLSVVLSFPSNATGNDCDLTLTLAILSDIFNRTMPFSLFCSFATAMLPLLSVRQTLLSLSRMSLNSSLGLHYPQSINQRTHSNFEKLQCAMFALTAIVNRRVEDECEVEAWCFLSEIIVANRPRLAFRSRQWLFLSLKRSLQRKTTCGKTALLLQWACITRMLCFLGLIKKGPEFALRDYVFAGNGEAPVQRLEDVSGLFDLLVALLVYNRLENNNRIAFRSSLQMLLFGENQNPTLTLDAELVDKASCTAPVTAENLAGHVAFHCFFHFLNQFVSNAAYFSSALMASAEDVGRVFAEHEMENLQLTKDTVQVPSYLSSTMLRGDEILTSFDEKEDIRLRIEFCNVVLDLLIGPIRLFCFGECSVGKHLNPDDCCTLALQKILFAVYSRKQQLSNENDNSDTCLRTKFSNCDSLVLYVEGFVKTVLPCLQDVLSIGKDDRQIEVFLLGAVNIMDDVSSEMENFSLPDLLSWNQLYDWLWAFYSCFCEEKSAAELARNCERMYYSGKRRFCGMPLDELDDVSRAVRYVRSSVLRSLWASLRCFLQRNSKGAMFDGLAYTQTEDARRSFIALLARISLSIITDLRLGLEGTSGSFTYDLYLSMIDCIELSLEIMSDALSKVRWIPSDVVTTLYSNCKASINFLEEIMCNFALHQAAAFKKTLMLCISTLPDIFRSVRLYERYTNDSYEAKPLVSILLAQLICVFKRKIEYGCLPDTNWEQVAGKDHFGETSDMHDFDDDVSMLSDVFVENEGSSGDLQRVSAARDNDDVILLRSERSWMWSMSCVFQSLEDNWEWSVLGMQGAIDHVVKGDWTKYFLVRQKELAVTLRDVSALFQYDAIEIASDQSAHSIFALSLPPACKAKLASALERIFVVLQKAMTVISSKLTVESARQLDHCESRSFVEALCSLYAWLRLDAEYIDLGCGVERWYMLEIHLSMQYDRDNRVFSFDASMLRRLPKIAHRVEELEAGLERLLKLVQDSEILKETDKRCKTLVTIHQLTKQTDVDHPSLKLLVSDKLSLLARNRMELQCKLGKPLENDETTEAKRKRTAEVRSRVRKECRRRVLRSRNEVVDMFLQMDRQTGVNETISEDSVPEDAFADLEDFLVEG